MKFNFYAVRDNTAEYFNKPFLMETDAVAVRGFLEAIRDPAAGNLHKYPEQFALFQVGSWNEETCEIVGVPPKHLCTGVIPTTNQE